MSFPWVLVTGSSGGIGSAVLEKFASEGYKIIAADVEPSTVIESENLKFVRLDLQELANCAQSASQFYRRVAEITGDSGLSCLINNAAVQILSSFSDCSRQDWDKTFDTNLKAIFFLTQLFITDLIKNCGAVVNISSIHAHQTKKGFLPYATSKAALSALTRGLALDLGGQVRVNAIEPAAISTPMLLEGFGDNREGLARLSDFHPVKRIGTPWEVAELAHFLVGERAQFLHGACIPLSGGVHAVLHDPDS